MNPEGGRCQDVSGELGPVLVKAWAESRSGWYEC